MGADLIVYIAKGPTKFSQKALKKAEKRADEIIKFASEVYETLKKENPTEKEIEFLDGALDDHRLRPLRDQEQVDEINECDLYLEEMAGANAKDVVEDFASWWEVGGARDTAARLDPDNRRQQIVVCGDMSWGDRPDGYGYITMSRAYRYDIPGILGVR